MIVKGRRFDVHLKRTEERAVKSIKVTQLRSNLQEYLTGVQNGESLAVTSRGKVIVRIIPPENEKELAKARLKSLQSVAWFGDVVTPTGDVWEAENANS